jgi:hypothetical protein
MEDLPKRNFIKQNSKLSFNEMMNAIQTTHTLSTKRICEILKTYRPWVTKYILPYLDKIFISNGKGKTSFNWVAMVRNKLQDNEFNESAWYKSSDFEELLKKSLYSCTRQTIKCSASVFVPDISRAEFCEQYKFLEEKIDEIRKKLDKLITDDLLEELKKIKKQQKELIENYLGKSVFEELKSMVTLDEYKPSKRPLSPAENYKLDFDYMNFMAVHDLKGYGGIDEQIYRDLFNNGAIKLVFKFVAKNGDIGEKIYYVYDRKNDNNYRLDDGSPVWTVPYSFFLKYKKN